MNSNHLASVNNDARQLKLADPEPVVLNLLPKAELLRSEHRIQVESIRQTSGNLFRFVLFCHARGSSGGDGGMQG